MTTTKSKVIQGDVLTEKEQARLDEMFKQNIAKPFKGRETKEDVDDLATHNNGMR